jgi:hypothetical protein
LKLIPAKYEYHLSLLIEKVASFDSDGLAGAHGVGHACDPHLAHTANATGQAEIPSLFHRRISRGGPQSPGS